MLDSSLKLPLITIITSVKNADGTIEKCIKSVVNQTYKNIQYIIIDACSTDNTLNIINRYSTNIDVLISEKDSGIYDAWNKGLARAKGDWIGFLGADDVYNLDAVEYMIQELQQSTSKPNFISGKILLKKGTSRKIMGKRWTWPGCKVNLSVAYCGALHHRSLFEKFGTFDSSFKSSGDYDFLLRVGSNLSALYCNRVLCVMNSGGISNSSILPIIETAKAKLKNKTLPVVFVYVLAVKGVVGFKIKQLIGLL
jgi:glycosyltransferase involved in cell wall biosynthesis